MKNLAQYELPMNCAIGQKKQEKNKLVIIYTYRAGIWLHAQIFHTQRITQKYKILTYYF